VSPATEPAGDTTPPEPANPTRRQQLARELGLEVHALRAALEESLQSFGLRLQGELAAVSRCLDEGVRGEVGSSLPSSKALGVMLGELRGLKLKPRKGRVKDLARIERAVAALAAPTDGH
jgi:hypothetical protein